MAYRFRPFLQHAEMMALIIDRKLTLYIYNNTVVLYVIQINLCVHTQSVCFIRQVRFGRQMR